PAVAPLQGSAPVGGLPAFSASQAADAMATVVGWRRVRTGVTLVLTALFIFCAVLVLALFGGLIAARARDPTAIAVTQVVIWLIALVADVVKTIGFGFCAGAPAQSGARGLGIASFVLAIGDAVMSPVVLLLLLFGGGMAALQRSPSEAGATAQAVAALTAA